MSRFLLDTDTLSLLQQGNATVQQNVNSHSLADIQICVITLWEQTQGWQSSITSARDRKQLATAHDRVVSRLLPTWCWFAVLAFSEAAILRFEQLLPCALMWGPCTYGLLQ